MIYSFAVYFTMVVCFFVFVISKLLISKRKSLKSKNAIRFLSFGLAMLPMNFIPILTDGPMLNRYNETVSPFYYSKASIIVLVLCIWGRTLSRSVLARRKIAKHK